ncbi:uncharacterized protein LOC117284589 isoform X4 [Fukomys damarensis]|uniref:uncharacterized protein LOC117284589 isoform X4 n=1 Tax=Fukomys damarensis TaxID=885580 RepID=UPI0014556DD3|nr:uncharacterized protein LOC117284589 isoform X4 [Fukomys damarensis]
MSGDAGFKSSIPGSPGGPEGGDIWRMQGEQRQPARVVVAGQGCCFALSLLPTQRVYSPTGMGFVILSSVFPSTSSKFFSLHRTLTRPSFTVVNLHAWSFACGKSLCSAQLFGQRLADPPTSLSHPVLQCDQTAFYQEAFCYLSFATNPAAL